MNRIQLLILPDKFGKTATDYAIKFKQHDMVSILQESEKNSATSIWKDASKFDW